MSGSVGDLGVIAEAREVIRGTMHHGDPGTLIDRLVSADPLWFLRPGGQPEHLLLAVQCLGSVPRDEARMVRARTIADTIIELLDIASVEGGFIDRDADPSPRSRPLAQAIAELVLPVLARLGPEWAGRARYQDWYLTVGQHMRCQDRYLTGGLHTGPSVSRWEEGTVGVAARLSFALLPRDHETLALLRHYAVDGHRSEIRQAAVKAMATSYRDAPETLPWLRRYASADGSSGGLWNTTMREVGSPGGGPPGRIGTDPAGRARQVAIELIAAAAHGTEEATAQWLLDEVAEDPVPEVASAAVRAIATLRAGDSSVMSWLVRIAVGDLLPRPGVSARSAAVEGLAAGWPGHPELLAVMCALSTDHEPDVCAAAVRALVAGWAGRPEPWQCLRDRIQPLRRVEVAVVEGIAAGWPEHPDTLPLLFELAADTRGERPNERSTAAAALAAGWPGHPDTRLLLHRAATDDAYVIGDVAVRSLAAHWADHPDTLPLLHRLAVGELRSGSAASVRLISQGWPDHPETLPLLHRLAADKDSGVAVTAVRELATGWAEHPRTRPLLHRVATGDGPAQVRAAAAMALAAGWPRHPDSLPAVRRLAEAGETAALRTLAAGWPDEPGTLPLIQELARTRRWLSDAPKEQPRLREPWPWQQHRAPAEPPLPEHEPHGLTGHDSPFAGVREVAIHRLATRWADHPDTPPLLHRIAATEPVHGVRLVAVEALAAGWADHPETVALLRDRAATDRWWLIRAAAVKALATRWPDDVETRRLLAERVADDDMGLEMGRLLAEGWTDDPAIRPILRDRLRVTGWRGDLRGRPFQLPSTGSLS